MSDKCPHCGIIHETTCPRIRALEYHPDGSLKRVEFHGQMPLAIGTLLGPPAYEPAIIQTGGTPTDPRQVAGRFGSLEDANRHWWPRSSDATMKKAYGV